MLVMDTMHFSPAAARGGTQSTDCASNTCFQFQTLKTVWGFLGYGFGADYSLIWHMAKCQCDILNSQVNTADNCTAANPNDVVVLSMNVNGDPAQKMWKPLAIQTILDTHVSAHCATTFSTPMLGTLLPAPLVATR